eukprot:TRINITY_DN743_c0_g1_i1.p1 TRINITY_DN743_c0_g1~~TRINITY_DN743_c0_g1_i1.p1  ORF type:complete len:189 (+),score=70.91 TRINITY_DN743_c0_g1_i1:53-568(+)
MFSNFLEKSKNLRNRVLFPTVCLTTIISLSQLNRIKANDGNDDNNNNNNKSNNNLEVPQFVKNSFFWLAKQTGELAGTVACYTGRFVKNQQEKFSDSETNKSINSFYSENHLYFSIAATIASPYLVFTSLRILKPFVGAAIAGFTFKTLEPQYFRQSVNKLYEFENGPNKK